MALRINNVPITSNWMFRENFKLEEVVPLLPLIVNKEGGALFTSEEDSRVLSVLKNSCKEDFSLSCVTMEDGHYTVKCDDEEDIVLTALSIEDKIETVRQLQAILLCQLGGACITKEELSCYGGTIGECGELVSGTVIVLQNDERKELRLFPYGEELTAPIYTIAIHNQSAYEGVAHLLVSNDQGKVIDDVRLGNGSIMYANCMNGYLIELLPQFSVSCDHYNFFDFRRKPHVLCRKVVSECNNIYVYNSDYSSKITQFTSDDERGLIGVKDGELFIMSNIFNPMTDFQFSLKDGETIVKVEVKGKIYMVLTSMGRTFSNFKKMILENIVSVGVSEACIPYAISSNGRLLTGSASECIVLEDNVYVAYSVDSDSMCIKGRDGVVRLPDDKTQDSSVKMFFYKEHCYYIDSASGRLYDSKNPSPIADRVLDFTLIKNELNDIGLAVYDGSNVEFINI